MSRVKLGENISLDVQKLLESRMLIQSNSGGGKSYAVRKLLEITHGKVQQIVLDVEGEFGTLREKFDYVLAGKGGDVDANPKTAELLAKKTLELEVSLIVDLFELKKPDRTRFVRNFLDALMDSPKELWHPVLVLVDEAHIFVPEKGESEAAGSVIDLATRGRKRGFAAVLATQRLSKLHKDAAAECLNKMIGRTSLDIDRKRAADELGFISLKDSLTLRNLEPGEFYSFGPAMQNEVKLGHVGKVETTHPKAGQRIGFKRTRPTAHIKAVLKKLTDLPKEAEEELRDREALQRRVKELERELRKKPETVSVAKPVVDQKAVERSVRATKKEIAKHILKLNYTLSNAISPVVNETIKKCNDLLEVDVPNEKFFKVDKKTYQPPMLQTRIVIPEDKRELGSWGKAEVPDSSLGACERKILGFLSMRRDEAYTKVQIGAMTGYRHSSGGFNNAISKLSKSGLIQRDRGGTIRLDPNADVSGLVDSTPHRLEDWINKLSACERAIYQTLLNTPDSEYTKEALGETTGYQPTSGGFNNALSRLSTLGLIQRDRGGVVRINPEVVSL